jgi:hypothetical protein
MEQFVHSLITDYCPLHVEFINIRKLTDFVTENLHLAITAFPTLEEKLSPVDFMYFVRPTDEKNIWDVCTKTLFIKKYFLSLMDISTAIIGKQSTTETLVIYQMMGKIFDYLSFHYNEYYSDLVYS